MLGCISELDYSTRYRGYSHRIMCHVWCAYMYLAGCVFFSELRRASSTSSNTDYKREGIFSANGLTASSAVDLTLYNRRRFDNPDGEAKYLSDGK